MKLYHGSLVIVNSPQILPRENGKTADFGTGFYTTTDYKQAERWVKIRKGTDQDKKGFVSEFYAADDLLSTPELKILKFASASSEWLDFVVANRKDKSFTHDYDIVFGPVANDRVYTTITLYEDEFLDKETTIARLKTFTLVDQILFHTEKSLAYLNFSRSITV
ncbi:MAG: DUF3990 domain-containing protein [Treponema sp.]|nr:DUF3990 domain-containing protein [Treponema sp.]MBR0477186.1 DUF3990 domain-containing protein [Treponema sp.]